MRAVAAFIALLCLAAAGAAGYELYQQIDPRPPAGDLAAAAPRDRAARPPDPPPPARVWPALFGEAQPPAPPARPAPAPAPVPAAVPVPPLASLGYRLNGVVRSDHQVWALVGHPAGSRLLRVGEALEPGVEVVAIDAEGVWLSRSGNPPELLGFPD